MAWTVTSLSADLGASDLTMSVASGTGFPAVGTVGAQNYRVRVDGEWFLADGQPVAGTITLKRRGDLGTAAGAHDILARVIVSNNPTDQVTLAPGTSTPIPGYANMPQTIGEDITFTSAQVAAWSKNQDFTIYKATAAAITLVAPSTATNGIQVTFASATAAAHVITATTLLGDAVSGSPHTTATFAAFIGATLTLEANNGLWLVKAAVGVTIT